MKFPGHRSCHISRLLIVDTIITVKGYDGKSTDIYLRIHNRVAFSDINEHFTIKAPKGIEKARNFDEVFG